jgi:virginiamycin B lyase
MFKKILVSSIIVASTCVVLSAQRGQVNLPDGPGKQAVESACQQCHALGLVSNAGHSREDWQNVVAMMVNDGAKLPQAEVTEVTDYLATNFPEKPAPPAVLLPGSAKVTFKEWTAPTPGSRPHDPLAAADGTIWYTGHMASVLGHIDPKTGDINEYHPKTPQSGPHGLAEDKDGNIWYTGNFKGYIGEFFPKTGEFKEYKLPAEARDPHTPIFDQKGILWFSVQGANMVGRLNPQTGDIKVVSSPTPRSNPYIFLNMVVVLLLRIVLPAEFQWDRAGTHASEASVFLDVPANWR